LLPELVGPITRKRRNALKIIQAVKMMPYRAKSRTEFDILAVFREYFLGFKVNQLPY